MYMYVVHVVLIYLFINTLRNFSPLSRIMASSFDSKLQSLAAMYWKFGSVID